MMKKWIVTCVALLIAASGYAQKGEQAAGVNLGFGTEASNFGIGAKYQYNFTDAWRLEGDLDYFFKASGTSMWDLGVNVHYLFPVAKKFAVYPLAGLMFTNWKTDYNVISGLDDLPSYDEMWGEGDDDWGDESDSFTKLAINLGAGVQYDINAKWRVNFEVKYQIINLYSQAVLSLGAVYKF